MKRILVVEDETIIRAALKRLLERNGYRVNEAGSVQAALEKYAPDKYDLIISDLRLPGAPGTELIRSTGQTPVLIMTSYASLRSAVDTMKMGAVDYIAKPFDHQEMLSTVARIIEDRAQQNAPADTTGAESQNDGEAPQGMIGTSPAMQVLFKKIRQVAPTTATVLVHGETGTGKELVARSIHYGSPRKDKPLISVNCAAIPETLIEAELFGHEKGAFTGAASAREGLIAAADGGTLFLDEIGELPLEAQARLLRVLQESEVRPIGAVQSRKVDVRLVAATHRNLKSLAGEGSFRPDLYYRINVLQLTLPPLRERGRDILELAEVLLERTRERLGRQGPTRFSAEAIQAITTYQWPGNIREMENAIERAVILSEDHQEISYELLDIDLELVPIEEVEDLLPPVDDNSGPMTLADTAAEDLSLEDYFQRFVLENQDQMSETELAKKLGISRKSLWERRKRLGIPRKKGTEG